MLAPDLKAFLRAGQSSTCTQAYAAPRRGGGRSRYWIRRRGELGSVRLG